MHTNIFFYLLVFLLGCAESSLLCLSFLRLRRAGLFLITVCGLPLRWPLCWSTGFRCTGFDSCGSRARELWLRGLLAPRHAESSQTRDRIPVPCTRRRIRIPWTTREVLFFLVTFTDDLCHTHCYTLRFSHLTMFLKDHSVSTHKGLYHSSST